MKIIFVCETFDSGSCIMRGIQMSEELNKIKFVSSRLLLLKDFEKDIENGSIKKDETIIFIKKAYNPKLAGLAKNNGNKIVLDLVDHTHAIKVISQTPKIFYKEYEGITDGIIFPNKYYLKSAGENPSVKGRVIHHHIDPRLDFKNKNKTEFKICYTGSSIDSLRKTLKLITSLSNDDIFSRDHRDFLSCPSVRHRYNCHLLIRGRRKNHWPMVLSKDIMFYHPNHELSKFKPPTRLSVAVGCDSNIICYKELIFTELLDESYPYFIDYINDDVYEDKINEAIDYAKNSFGTKTWQEGLDMMRSLRGRLNITNIAMEYIKFLEEL